MRSNPRGGHSARPVGARRQANASDASAVVSCLRRLFKGVHEYSKAVQRRGGLSSPQLWALSILQEAPALSLGELAVRMYAHPSTVSGVVDRLVERGAVRREVDRRDRRGLRLWLTAAGRRLLRRSPPPVQDGLRRALEEMPARQLRLLRTSLEHIVQRSELARVQAPFFEA